MRFQPVTLRRARRLRRMMTKPEVVLWLQLRECKLGGLRFRRQHPVGPYILDFYCASAKLCVEVDGLVHYSPNAAVHDERRTAWLGARGISVIRFGAPDILRPELIGGVLASIEAAAAPTTA